MITAAARAGIKKTRDLVFGKSTTLRDQQASSLVQDTFALLALRPLFPGFLPLSSSALRPAALLLLANDLVANRRQSAIEFGAGASTIVLGNAMRQFGGRLFSVEHDLEWLEVMQSLVHKYALTDHVTLIHAPLEPLSEPAPLAQSHSWYARTPILAALGSAQVDFAIVDGPPAYKTGSFHQRYPALPFLLPRLRSRCLIALDDASRQGERDVYQAWNHDSNIQFRYNDETGLAIGTRGQAYHS